MQFFRLKGRTRDIVLILIGTFFMALGVNMVYDPMQMVTGGVTGIAIIIKYFTEGLMDGGFPLWASNLVLNVPLFLVAFKVLGFKSVSKTVFATASLTAFLYILPMKPLFEADYLLAGAFGGTISGVGIGLVFATMATTGGTDTLGMLIQRLVPHYSMPQLLFIIDGLVVLGGAVVFGMNSALYSVIAVYMTSKASEAILEGMKFAKGAYIISEKADDIANEIMSKLDRGVTGLKAVGMYSKKDKNVLFCVVSRKEMVQVNEIVNKIDTRAFVVMTDVREVRGEGFIEIKQ